MTEWLEFFLHRVAYAAAGGGVALLVAYCVARWAVGLSPLARVWILRLSIVKLCIALAPIPAIALFHLPAQPASGVVLAPTPYSPQLTWALGMFFIIWLVGAGIEIVRIVVGWQGSQLARRTARTNTDMSIYRLCRDITYKLRLKHIPELVIHPAFASPGLLGGLKPVVVLPSSDYPAEQLSCAVAHELAHVKHRDLAWGWLVAIADVVFWFHPLLMLAKREMLHWQEAAADEVAARITRTPAASYAETLVAFASACRGKNALQPVFSVASDAKRIERRLVTLFDGRQQQRAGWFLACLFLAPMAFAMTPWSIYSLPVEATPIGVAKASPIRGRDMATRAVAPAQAINTYSAVSPVRARVAAPASGAARVMAPPMR